MEFFSKEQINDVSKLNKLLNVGQSVIVNSQAGQDFFVLKCLNYKKNGFFLELGGGNPIIMSNTYDLEKNYNWKGIIIEYNEEYRQSYNECRKSMCIIKDATKINYKKLFEDNNVPLNIDYLQIDLEVTNKSTLDALQKLDLEVMDRYKFAVITFEHDIYRGDYFNTRNISREIFSRRGYIRVFSDVTHSSISFEDWYIHPDLVDNNYINNIKTNLSLEWNDILKRL
jgi:hypothetical protein